MPRENRRDAPDARISRAQKCKEQREGTKNIHCGLPSPVAPLQPKVALRPYIVLGAAELGFASPPGAASYFDAHLACTCSATKLPLFAKVPSTSACDLSTNVSGSGSLPTYVTGSSFPSPANTKSTRPESRLIVPGSTVPPTRMRCARAVPCKVCSSTMVW